MTAYDELRLILHTRLWWSSPMLRRDLQVLIDRAVKAAYFQGLHCSRKAANTPKPQRRKVQ